MLQFWSRTHVVGGSSFSPFLFEIRSVRIHELTLSLTLKLREA